MATRRTAARPVHFHIVRTDCQNQVGGFEALESLLIGVNAYFTSCALRRLLSFQRQQQLPRQQPQHQRWLLWNRVHGLCRTCSSDSSGLDTTLHETGNSSGNDNNGRTKTSNSSYSSAVTASKPKAASLAPGSTGSAALAAAMLSGHECVQQRGKCGSHNGSDTGNFSSNIVSCSPATPKAASLDSGLMISAALAAMT